jgi:hypothetical protein
MDVTQLIQTMADNGQRIAALVERVMAEQSRWRLAEDDGGATGPV